MATIHNKSNPGDIAKTVLMPGDPLRARYLAENYLDNPVLFNDVRGMLGYTGTFKGKAVSVMGSGMGIASIGIYSHELFNHYDVDNIIRVGSSGSYCDELKLYDMLMVTDAFSDSTYARCYSGFEGNITEASHPLCEKFRQSANALGYTLHEGRVHSSDTIYYKRDENETPYWIQVREAYNCLAVDMESFSLFHNAAMAGKHAGCLLTISDEKTTLKRASLQEREKSFTQMMEVALGILVSN